MEISQKVESIWNVHLNIRPSCGNTMTTCKTIVRKNQFNYTTLPDETQEDIFKPVALRSGFTFRTWIKITKDFYEIYSESLRIATIISLK